MTKKLLILKMFFLIRIITKIFKTYKNKTILLHLGITPSFGTRSLNVSEHERGSVHVNFVHA